eukprot:1014994-Prorocentrum_minimum.AAC.1
MLIYVPAMFASAVEPAGGVVEAGVPHDEPSDERHDPSEPKLLAHRLERRAEYILPVVNEYRREGRESKTKPTAKTRTTLPTTK